MNAERWDEHSTYDATTDTQMSTQFCSVLFSSVLFCSVLASVRQGDWNQARKMAKVLAELQAKAKLLEKEMQAGVEEVTLLQKSRLFPPPFSTCINLGTPCKDVTTQRSTCLIFSFLRISLSYYYIESESET